MKRIVGVWHRFWNGVPPRQRALLLVLLLAVALANVAQPYPDIAPLQHLPTLIAIAAAPALLRRWPLSGAALACLVGFLLLHTLGGRYTYSNVPYDLWARTLTGHELSGLLGRRNGYDRLVHLAFGLLWVSPIVELLRRHGGIGLRAAVAIAVLFVGAVSALYEVFEWLLTLTAPAAIADDYNGQQGDAWDSQKDMALALLGAAVAGAALWLRERRR